MRIPANVSGTSGPCGFVPKTLIHRGLAGPHAALVLVFHRARPVRMRRQLRQVATDHPVAGLAAATLPAVAEASRSGLAHVDILRVDARRCRARWPATG